MDKKLDAARLLRAMGDVDDKYIEEAIGTQDRGQRKAVTTSLRRYSGIIGAVAAALLLVAAGSYLLRMMGSTSNLDEHIEVRNAELYTQDGEINFAASERDDVSSDGERNYEVSGDWECVAPAAEAEDSGVDLSTEAASEEAVDGIDEGTGLVDIEVPESVNGSVLREYSYGENAEGLIEVLYLDEDGNVICTIRKAPGDGDISGCPECFAVIHKIDVEGLDNVSLSGNGERFALATWSQAGFAYSIFLEDMVTEQEMLDLISQVS